MSRKTTKHFLVLFLSILIVCFGYISVSAESLSSDKLLKEGIEIMETAGEEIISSAGTAPADWYLLAASRMDIAPEGVKSAFISAIEDKYKSGGYRKVTDCQRVAIALTAANGNPTNATGDGKINLLADGVYSNPKLKISGINANVFGLLSLDNYNAVLPNNSLNTRKDIIGWILDSQLSPSGGFALTGTNPDPDVTSMVITALAPYYKTDLKIATAIEKALLFLSDVQTELGGFKSYGVYNLESTAQVIIALTALGIDPTTDERFIKNGNDPFDALLDFKVGKGLFAHTLGGKYNGIATAQAFCAFSAYYRFKNNLSPLFANLGTSAPIYKKHVGVSDKLTSSSTVQSQKDEQTSTEESSAVNSTVINSSSVSDDTQSLVSQDISIQSEETLSTYAKSSKTYEKNVLDSFKNENGELNWRLCVVTLIAACAICLIAAILLLKKKGYRLVKKPCSIMMGLVAILLVIALIIGFTDIKSVDEHYKESSSVSGSGYGVVTISVDCKVLLNNPEVVPNNLKDYLPDGGYIVKPTKVHLNKGDTAFSVIMRTAKEKGVQLEYSGHDQVYIEGINYFYEFSCGELSGWVYGVNGVRSKVSCSDQTLKNGDVINFSYTLNLGNDVFSEEV